ncbi:MAG TPA: hypothetical protein VM553_00015 [Dongiaceae bacterium]|nr:hypothetical protein [Dongiaceae bacterium]
METETVRSCTVRPTGTTCRTLRKSGRFEKTIDQEPAARHALTGRAGNAIKEGKEMRGL